MKKLSMTLCALALAAAGCAAESPASEVDVDLDDTIETTARGDGTTIVYAWKTSPDDWRVGAAPPDPYLGYLYGDSAFKNMNATTQNHRGGVCLVKATGAACANDAECGGSANGGYCVARGVQTTKYCYQRVNGSCYPGVITPNLTYGQQFGVTAGTTPVSGTTYHTLAVVATGTNCVGEPYSSGWTCTGCAYATEDPTQCTRTVSFPYTAP